MIHCVLYFKWTNLIEYFAETSTPKYFIVVMWVNYDANGHRVVRWHLAIVHHKSLWKKSNMVERDLQIS